MQHNQSLSPALKGVFLMVVVAILASIDAVIVRSVSPDVHPFVISFTRALFGLIAILPWILARPQILRSRYRALHAIRAALKLAALTAFFAAFAQASLADVTAIAFTAPLFVTIGAWWLFSEKPKKIRILAMVFGFLGVLLVLRPGQGGFISNGLLLALLGAFFSATVQLMLKPMSRRDQTQTLVAWNLILTVPIAAVFAAFVWESPTMEQWRLLALQGVLGAISMGCVTQALASAEASLIAPLDFLRLPFVALLAYLFFGQSVSSTTWLGGGMIFAATFIMAQSAREVSMEPESGIRL